VSVSAAHLSCSVAIHLQASSPRPAALNPPSAAIFEFVGCRAGVSARFLLSLQQERQQQQQKQTEVPVTRPQENKLQPASCLSLLSLRSSSTAAHAAYFRF